MEEQTNILDLEIGTKEPKKLAPAKVKIVDVYPKPVGQEKKNNKLICLVKHPLKDEAIEVSEVKVELNGKLQTGGLWVNLDEDGKLRKGSAISRLMDFMKVSKIKELVDKEIETVENTKGYLCLKAY